MTLFNKLTFFIGLVMTMVDNIINDNKPEISFFCDRLYKDDIKTKNDIVADVRAHLSQERFKGVVHARIS